MLFSSPVFLVAFLPGVLALYYLIPRRFLPARNLLLLAASLGFYAWGEPWFVLVMIASIIMNYLFGLWTARTQEKSHARRWALGVTVAFNLGLLFVFKYLGFVLQTLRAATGYSLPFPEIALPIGVSFFTFQAMSYVLDVAKGRAPVQKNPLWVGLYISFFPQLIAGPIVKYETVAYEILHRRENWEDFSTGLCRFAVGLSKKVLLSNTMALVADSAYAKPELSVGMAWLGALAYSFQIFFDFSGYSDMAIGLGKMFGFHFLENFNYPYISRSITEFWRRWHISLSTWFRDYVYIPLGGSRVGTVRRFFNLFVVWLLTGVWHGANWTFLLWGLYYFVLLAAEKAAGLDKKALGLWRAPATFLLVNFGWVLFRAETLGAAGRYLGAMLGFGVNGLWDAAASAALRDGHIVYLLAAAFSLPVGRWVGKTKLGRSPAGALCYALGMAVLVVLTFSYVAKGAYNPFIYFNF